MNNYKLLVLELSIVLLFLSCTNPNENNLPLRSDGLTTPIVTGLRITKEDSPEEIAIWGNPSDSKTFMKPNTALHTESAAQNLLKPDSEIPNNPFDEMRIPFPNPSNSTFTIYFGITKKTNISLWVVQARWGGNDDQDITTTSGAVVMAPATFSIRDLRREKAREPGFYGATWDGRDNFGNDVPTGFYRVYLETDYFKSYRDVFIYRTLNDLPATLKKIIYPDL